MKTKILALLATLILTGLWSVANASSVYLQPADQIAALGDMVTVELWWDFSDDVTFGGGTDIGWDTGILSLVSVVFDSNPAFDPAFTRAGDLHNGQINGLATGAFEGLSGPMLIATLTFEAIGAGTSVLDLSANGGPAGPFVSTNTFVAQSVNFIDGSITVVPIPAGLWLMIGGLGALVGFRRKA